MPKNSTKNILIIAGSDSCCGAGIQTDLKTASKIGVYATTAITCLTAQNSKKVAAISYVDPDFIVAQISAIISDIKIDFIKIGMLGNGKIITKIANFLQKNAKNIPIILDPVMVATSGDLLLEESAIESLKNDLITNSYLITPNIFEAEILSSIKINNFDDIKKAAQKIQNLGIRNVLIKGGHCDFGPKNKIQNFLLEENGKKTTITNKKLHIGDTHGSGCTLSSAITSYLAQNNSLENSIRKANKFTYFALKNSFKIGDGSLILKNF